MVLKLYGMGFYTCTRRVGIILHEKKVPFELVTVDVPKGEHKTPEHLTKQPFGQIPYLDDDGFIVYESRAIGRYIATKYADRGTPLLPEATNLKEMAMLEQALSIEISEFNQYAEKAVWEMVVNPMCGVTPDKAVFDKLIASLERKLDAYDKILGKQKYLAGNDITIADLFHLPYAAMLSVAGSDAMLTRPNVKRWLDDITARPSWQAVKDGVQTVIAA